MAHHRHAAMLNVSSYQVNAWKVLGKGSFGIVHKALDKNGADVAAKRIDFVPQNKKKLPQVLKGLNKLTQLDHENIARIFNVSEQDDTVWVFMELCNQGDLINYLQGGEVVTANEKLKLMLDIAEGVEYLHSKNVVHRDIKPNNILVSGQTPTAKLTDFDHSKFLDEYNVTSAMTTNVGTVAFKAPEFYIRTDGGQLNYHRNVDIYAMGLSFLAMIQNHPFLIPKLETPNEASELSPGYTIGMLMAERKRYGCTPLEIVKLSCAGSGAADQMWNKVRREIQKMTHVEPKNRSSALEVVQSLTNLVSVEDSSLIPVVKIVRLVPGATHGTDLVSLRAIRFSVMASGRVILCANHKKDARSVLHCYIQKDGDWMEVDTVRWCGGYNVYTEGLEIGGRELLVKSCGYCHKISLHNLETGETSMAFDDDNFCLGQMCRGDPGQVVVVDQKQKQVLLLDCSSPTFSLIKKIPVAVGSFDSICYIPGGVLVISNQIGSITAVSTDTGKQLWEVTGQVQGKQCYFCGLAFSPALDALFVADGFLSRILVLNPGDESLRQILPLEMLGIRDLCLHSDQLIVLHGGLRYGEVKVSHFSLQ